MVNTSSTRTQAQRSLGDHVGAGLIQQHRALVRELLGQFPESEEIETAGDSFLLVFSKPSAAVTFGLVLLQRQKKLAEGAGQPVPLRIGIHLGEVVIEEHEAGQKAKELYGIQIDTGARVMSLHREGQWWATLSAGPGTEISLKFAAFYPHDTGALHPPGHLAGSSTATATLKPPRSHLVANR